MAIALLLTSHLPAVAQQDELQPFAVETDAWLKRGAYTKALATANIMAERAKVLAGEDDPAYATALGWIARVHLVAGRLREALPLSERSLRILESKLPEDDPRVATAINNLGFSLQVLGRYEEAEQRYKQALRLRERAPTPNVNEVADSLNNVAQIYKREWRVAEAVPLLERSFKMRIESLGPDAPQVADGLQNLAATLELQGHFADAEPPLRRALEIRQKSAEGPPTVASTMGKLAQNLFKQRQFAAAEQMYRDAIAIIGQTPDAISGRATLISGLAANQLAADRADQAEALFRDALSLSEASLAPTDPELAQLHMGLAVALSRQHRDDDALAAIRTGTALRVARGDANELTRQHYLLHLGIAWHAAAARTPTAGTAGSAVTATANLADETLVIAQRATQTVTGVAISKMAARFAARDPELQALARQRDDLEAKRSAMEQQLSALLAVPFEQRGAEDEKVRDQLRANSAEMAALNATLKQRFPAYFNLLRPEPLDVARVRQLLAEHEALIVIVTGHDENYVWTITRASAVWHRVDLGVDQLTQAITALRDTIEGGKSLQNIVAKDGALFDIGLSHYLYGKLLGPSEQVVADKKHLLVAAFGPMTSLPLQLLVTDGPIVNRPGLKDLAVFKDVHWLIRRHAVSVLPSITSLEELRVLATRHGEGSRAMIGFGPTFGSDGSATATRGATKKPAKSPSAPRVATSPVRGINAYWHRGSVNLDELHHLEALPETEVELRVVAKYLGADERDLKLGAAASEASVRSMDLTPYRILYFATHALVAGDIGLAEPALVLSLPAEPTEPDDGLLTASEISQLKLNADWAVLSACNTAAGDKPGADALSGLARAFFYAGTRSLLVSNWNVISSAATKLTTSTFEILKKEPSTTRAEALRRAMLAYIDTAKTPRAAYPDAWAPFSLIGDGGRVETRAD